MRKWGKVIGLCVEAVGCSSVTIFFVEIKKSE